MVTCVRCVILGRAVDEADLLSLKIEAPDGAVVARCNKFVCIRCVNSHAIDGTRMRLKL